MEPRAANQYYFHSIPRSASTLLIRILNLPDQPNFNHARGDGYFFLPYYLVLRDLGILGKDPTTWSEEAKSKIRQILRECFRTFSQFLKETHEKGQKCLIKEHCDLLVDPSAFAQLVAPDLTGESIFREDLHDINEAQGSWSPENHTLFPDEFLVTWKPTFLIRHPAMAFPSQFRALNDIERIRGDNNTWDVTMTYKWARKLYSLYVDVILKDAPKANDGSMTWPIVLEANDVLFNRAVIRKYCNLVGLEEEKLKFTWDVAVEGDEILENPVMKRMASTLISSTGILGEKLPTEVDIATEAGKWREEFGEIDGKRMEEWVRAAMPDYLFLWERRLRE